jgi:hypothetical protein
MEREDREQMGELLVREMAWKRQREEVEELLSRTLLKRVLPGISARVEGGVSGEEERYEGVEDYDPVLRSHCRL